MKINLERYISRFSPKRNGVVREWVMDAIWCLPFCITSFGVDLLVDVDWGDEEPKPWGNEVHDLNQVAIRALSTIFEMGFLDSDGFWDLMMNLSLEEKRISSWREEAWGTVKVKEADCKRFCHRWLHCVNVFVSTFSSKARATEWFSFSIRREGSLSFVNNYFLMF